MPAGRIASGVSEPASASMARCTVPSPPQTKSSSTPVRKRALHLLRHVTALRAPRSTAGRRLPGARAPAAARAGHPRMSYPAWATTATRVTSPPSREARVTTTSAHERGDADDRAAGDVGRMVHAAVHPRERHVDRDQRRHGPDRSFRDAVLDARGHEERDSAVDGDRRRGVARRVARARPGASRGGEPPAGGGGRPGSSSGTTPTRPRARSSRKPASRQCLRDGCDQRSDRRR